MSALGQKRTSLSTLHGWWRPRPVGDFYLRPVRAHVKREISVLRGWQPIAALRLGRRIALHINRERTVGIVFQRLVFRSRRIPPDVVRCEEVILVVKSERPESAHRGRLVFGESNGVSGCTVEALTCTV